MEKREEALREALVQNAEETTRWETYQKDNEQAIENLESFSKRLVVDVMVPVGRKAYTAGQLIHTNEVMVSHYQGYFSECSSHTAKEICYQRIRMAKEQLEKLKTEADLWTNKLEKPYVDGVLPSAGQHEILEEYDDEKEKLWREQHKLRVRQAKLQEKEARKKVEATVEKMPDDVEEMLAEAEQMEELRAELDSLQLEDTADSEEILRRLLSGEMKIPPPKPRVEHSAKGEEVKLDNNRFPGVVKKTDLKSNNTPPTNNNSRVNPELLLRQAAVEGVIDDGNESDDSASEVPEEVQLIEEQAKFLPVRDQIGFYQYQLQIIEQKLLSCTVSNATEIEQKLHLFKVRELLEELLEVAEHAEGELELTAAEEELSDSEEAAQTEMPACTNDSKHQSKSKRITFAFEDRTLEFHKTETVAEMLPKPDEPSPPRRDIITLDDPGINSKSVEQNLESSPKVDKKQLILNKVEENLKYVTEHQSVPGFDLVNKIINNAEGTSKTLHMSFKHSSQTASEAEPDTDGTSMKIPRSPADLYPMFVQNSAASSEKQQPPKTLFIDAYEGEDQVKVPILKEQDREAAYKDLRMEFSNPSDELSSVSESGISQIEPSVPLAEQCTVPKSIIKNKQAVETETHLINGKNNKQKIKPPQKSKNDQEYMSAYDKVMSDVVEKPLSEPDPLPTGKYIDALAPKKRISRFKQMRSGVQTT